MDPRDLLGEGTLLVDGTICAIWDGKAISDLYSGKAGYSGMNVQVAATLGGTIAAIGAPRSTALDAAPTAPLDWPRPSPASSLQLTSATSASTASLSRRSASPKAASCTRRTPSSTPSYRQAVPQ